VLTLALPSLQQANIANPTPTDVAISSPSPNGASPSSNDGTLPPPRTTPPGTPAPTPDVALSDSASAEVSLTPKPAATPTASPEPGLWRLQGYVVDEGEQPLAGVCVVVGPHGCQQFSPHTDENGHWFLDIAADKGTAFDFYFEIPGHQTVWWHSLPNGPTEFNVVLRKG
jgi:hypothetical protein